MRIDARKISPLLLGLVLACNRTSDDGGKARDVPAAGPGDPESPSPESPAPWTDPGSLASEGDVPSTAFLEDLAAALEEEQKRRGKGLASRRKRPAGAAKAGQKRDALDHRDAKSAEPPHNVLKSAAFASGGFGSTSPFSGMLGRAETEDIMAQMAIAYTPGAHFDLGGMDLEGVRTVMHDKAMKHLSVHGSFDLMIPGELHRRQSDCLQRKSTSSLCAVYKDLLAIHGRVAQKAVALIHRTDMASVGDTYKLGATTVGDRYDVCEKDEALIKRAEPSVASCTGVIVGRRKVLTARHCMRAFDYDRRNIFVVFGYRHRADGSAPTDVPKSDVFTISELETDLPGDAVLMVSNRDFPVGGMNFAPREYFSPRDYQETMRVYTAGYPLGMPLTYCNNGKILSLREPILTDLDVFRGNSGSPVYNSIGELVGIVTGGEEDFTDEGCQRVKRCWPDDPPETCIDESVLSVRVLYEYLEPR